MNQSNKKIAAIYFKIISQNTVLFLFCKTLFLSPQMAISSTKKEHHKLTFKSMVEKYFENNTIRYKELATNVSGRNNCCCTLLLHFGTRAYLFTPDKGSSCVFSTRNNCCEFLAYYGDIFKMLFNLINLVALLATM